MIDTFILILLGDIFEKLEDEDEQGWCKGRKDGRVGKIDITIILINID